MQQSIQCSFMTGALTDIPSIEVNVILIFFIITDIIIIIALITDIVLTDLQLLR